MKDTVSPAPAAGRPAAALSATHADKTLLTMDAVSHTYSTQDGKRIRAVGSVSCEIKPGEFISILGPSGCGKSTLLMMIAGLLPATEGRVVFNGAPVSGPLEDSGIVFQDAVLLPWRTIQENVALPGEIAGLTKEDRLGRAGRMLRLVQLAGFEDKYPRELSGGMQQRTAIARALLMEPSLLLMDEPFGALDAMTRDQMNVELQRISVESKATVIFVTHSISEAAFLSDRVIVMSARPSTVRGIVKIAEPRPRPASFMTTARFGEYVAELRHMLDTAGDQP